MNSYLLGFVGFLFAFGISACNSTSAPNSQLAPKKSQLPQKSDVYVGQVTETKDGIDGSTITLYNKKTNTQLSSVISIPNLGPNSEFDFNHIQKGNILKVYGEMFIFGGGMSMSTSAVKSYVPIKFASKKATPTELKLCEALGGIVKPTGKAQYEQCVQTYSDAGESCNDASECFGRCVLTGNVKEIMPGSVVNTGVCEADNIRFGCTSLVNDGKFEGTLCID